MSNLTAWFDWNAIGAVSTALALYMTIRLATEARRERRQREAVLLGTAAHILRAAFLAVRSATKDAVAGDIWTSEKRSYLEQRLAEDRIAERLDAIAPFHFPTIETAEYYQAALLALANIQDERNSPSAQWLHSVSHDHKQLLLNIEALEDSSYQRSHCLIRVLARRAWRRLKRDAK